MAGWRQNTDPVNAMISSVTCKNPITEQINSELQTQSNKQGALGSHTAMLDGGRARAPRPGGHVSKVVLGQGRVTRRPAPRPQPLRNFADAWWCAARLPDGPEVSWTRRGVETSHHSTRCGTAWSWTRRWWRRPSSVCTVGRPLASWTRRPAASGLG